MVSDNKTNQEKKPSSEPDFFHVGTGFKIVGSVTGSGLCVINGSFEGNLDAVLVKFNTGSVFNGEIRCQRLDVAGEIQGIIHSQELLLRSTSLIKGSIHYETIVMEKGAVVDGDIKLAQKTTTKKEDTYFWSFPDEVNSLLPAAKQIKLSLADGNPLPPGFELKGTGLTVSPSSLKDHIRSGGSAALMLQVDDKLFSFSVPASISNGAV